MKDAHDDDATHRHAGRYAGSYDLEIEADMGAVAGLDRGRVTPWLSVSPHVQWVAAPGALDGVDDAVILGVRVQAAF